MSIESRTTKETLIRLSIATLACAIFCVMFLRDGFVKYPRENLEFARERFPQQAAEVPSANPLATREAIDQVHKGMSLEEVQQVLGEPAFNNQVEVFWVGRTGYIWAKLNRAGLVEQSTWEDAPHTMSDLQWQKVGAVVAAVLTVVGLAFLIRAARIKVVLDDGGLTYNRGPAIEWDQMRSLDSSLYKRKGWVMLHFERGGMAGQQKLHGFHIAKFKAIVTELCARKGFDSPFVETKTKAEQDAAGSGQAPSA